MVRQTAETQAAQSAAVTTAIGTQAAQSAAASSALVAVANALVSRGSPTPEAATTPTKTKRGDMEARYQGQKAAAFAEQEARAKSGYAFTLRRTQIMVALRSSATTTPQLFPDLYGLDLYEGLLKLSAVSPKVVESLADAHLRMTHILAVYLTDLKLTYNDVVDGIGAAETPVANDTQLSFDENLSDQLKCDAKLKGNARRRVPPSTMDRLTWKENRTALATMIGYVVDQDAGVALTAVIDNFFTRVGKEKS